MITFISATPGGGKTLTAVEMLYKLSKDNVKNLNFNYFLFKSVYEQLEQKNLLDELRTCTIVRGQGLHKQTKIMLFADDYFDFLKDEYHINIVLDGEYDDLIKNYPSYYFERVYYLNEIINRLNEEHNLKIMQFKHVRAMFTNINGLLLSQVRPLPSNYDWRDLPFGAFVVYDEAQLIEIFSEEYKKVDPIVRDLTVHRHKSYDLIFISQDPGLVHKYIRKLASHHIHLINAFGFEQSVRVEWSTCQEQPNALRNIARSEYNGIYRFPKSLYGVYVSTTANTRVKRYPWKKIALISAIGAVGIYGVSGLFKDENALVCLVSAGHYGCINPNKVKEKENEKSEQKTDANRNKQPVNESPGSEPSENASSEVENQEASGVVASAGSINGVNASIPEVVYDPSKPYEYKPVSTLTPVNQRVFSGCVSFKGKHYAVDQQGTLIEQFSMSDCKKILDKSYNRPFDYFGDRNKQQVAQQTNSSSDANASITQDQLEQLRYLQYMEQKRQQNPQIYEESQRMRTMVIDTPKKDYSNYRIGY